jgi:hypothetical protein
MSNEAVEGEVPESPTAKRIREIKAQREQLADERLKREQECAEQELLEREERALRDEAAIAAAEAQHGPVGKRLAVVQTTEGVIIVKRPNPLVFKRYQDEGNHKSEAVDKLVRPCLVYPTKTEFDRICEEQPATLVRVGSHVVALAGFRQEEAAGK